MIALVTTLLVVFYVLIPGILFRFGTSFSSVKLKSFQRTRTQEVTFATSVALLPFLLAFFGVKYVPVMRDHPVVVAESSGAEWLEDNHRLGAMLTGSDFSKLAGCEPSGKPCAGADAYWNALHGMMLRQERLLSWYFLFVFAEGWAFGVFAGKYGDWRHGGGKRKGLLRLYTWFARKFVLPNLSEWHVLLTGFNWPKGVVVVVDVLQTDGHLYRGRVEDYFVDVDGKFSGLLLHDVDRFDLNAYRRAQEMGHPETLASENFWKTIPSENFYIGHGSISNLNIRFMAGGDEVLEEVSREALEGEAIDADISVESENADEAEGQHPDIYS
ncbi:MAG TPA: hypothetical protein VL346_13805 [Acidobacteriaceae bacterium]|jgi:hypothetical protein|nr:hypothetical protein [Acidobacteriaceae bacterium]